MYEKVKEGTIHYKFQSLFDEIHLRNEEIIDEEPILTPDMPLSDFMIAFRLRMLFGAKKILEIWYDSKYYQCNKDILPEIESLPFMYLSDTIGKSFMYNHVFVRETINDNNKNKSITIGESFNIDSWLFTFARHSFEGIGQFEDGNMLTSNSSVFLTFDEFKHLSEKAINTSVEYYLANYVNTKKQKMAMNTMLDSIQTILERFNISNSNLDYIFGTKEVYLGQNTSESNNRLFCPINRESSGYKNHELMYFDKTIVHDKRFPFDYLLPISFNNNQNSDHFYYMVTTELISLFCSLSTSNAVSKAALDLCIIAFKEYNSVISNLKDENAFIKNASKIAQNALNKDCNLFKQFDYIALIDKSKFKLSDVTIQFTIPNEGVILDNAVVDCFNIKYGSNTEPKKAFSLYDRIDNVCINTLIKLAYYKRDEDKIAEVIDNLQNLKDTHINKMLKDIFPNLITGSKSLIDKKNRKVNVNLEITNPSYLIK